MQNAIPTIEVEELRFTESVVLYEDDYSWYDFPEHNDYAVLCVSFGCAADNNYDVIEDIDSHNHPLRRVD